MNEKEIRIDLIGGNCPVQAEGLIDGAPSTSAPAGPTGPSRSAART